MDRAAHPEHPSLIDEAHVTDELFGFVNVPNAYGSTRPESSCGPPIPPTSAIPPFATPKFRPASAHHRYTTEVKKIRPTPTVIWPRCTTGRPTATTAATPWPPTRSWPAPALAPPTRQKRRPPSSSAASLALRPRRRRAAPWFRRAHRLQPDNWTYKRQAWSLAGTVAGQDSDLLQGPNDLYDGNWLDDVRAQGAENYYEPFE